MILLLLRSQENSSHNYYNNLKDSAEFSTTDNLTALLKCLVTI